MLKAFRVSCIIIMMSLLLITPIACKSTPTPGVSAEWFGTKAGVNKFDGTTWTTYDTSNSGLASNYVSVIAIEDMGNK